MRNENNVVHVYYEKCLELSQEIIIIHPTDLLGT